MEYLLLEKHGNIFTLVEKGTLTKLYKFWLENPSDRMVVKIVEIEVKEGR